MKSLSIMNETELRDYKVEHPISAIRLAKMAWQLTHRQHDYGTCVYAASILSTAMFYYVTGKLGMTGFQASCADLDTLKRTRHMKGPFAIVNAEDLLYPQYDIRKKVDGYIEDWKHTWANKEAEKMINDKSNSGFVAPSVLSHWKYLASLKDAKENK